MKIKYEKKAIKFLAKTEKALVNNIKKAISGLTENPPQGDIKTLDGYKDGRKRLRYGKYRIIFRYTETEDAIKILLIMNIGSRGDIYSH